MPSGHIKLFQPVFKYARVRVCVYVCARARVRVCVWYSFVDKPGKYI